MKNIVVLVSGGGTNLQALIDAEKRGEIAHGKITCVVSSNDKAYALERARQNGIGTRVIKRKEYTSQAEYDNALVTLLNEEKADLIVLAGFMTILGDGVIKAFENRIINIHPSLIPAFCGEGFYGLHVHERALERGIKLTGATAHFVNEICDGGPIIMQKAVEIQNGDTPEILQKRVMEQAEWKILPRSVALFCQDKLRVENGKVIISD
ncbi:MULTISPECIES: phosphoribosylglycinamide formyltransferase [unclassified Ruminococcus]|uniref:phosphoribosylglycinamide formyltransferase n=1 Tax=unclassified Ruminococcus TaxID=2608920 RepID=UPI00210C63D5|nr:MULTISPECIES: phosphoribosylglycinamide formyltransferase [unclassified Ruminococcus]MCQ4022718.1 phosphoribosylglycinamide formyltransferase [Ruminococcus sp. zg-924]MCQ4114958.1 phosphoribosylglycinamide formyltransferase [Ruminococcus sp. zg-921]